MKTDKRLKIYLADLSYYNDYSTTTISIPLNIGYIASYTMKLFSQECDIHLFKNPDKLKQAILANPPDILGLSCYYWNKYLNANIAINCKAISKNTVVILGGAEIDRNKQIQNKLFSEFKNSADILIVDEGESAFADIVKTAITLGMDNLLNNVADINEGVPIDLKSIPSPFLSGILDRFLTAECLPIIQTSRMCAYNCTFCCAGRQKGKIRAFPLSVVEDEINYIAQKYKNFHNAYLYITDVNFGTLRDRDYNVATYIDNANKKYGYPGHIRCYYDKKLTVALKKIMLLLSKTNTSELVIPFQSLNKKSLEAINRINIKEEDFKEYIDWGRKMGFNTTTEIIFGFPFETKKSFIDSIEYLIQNKLNDIGVHNLFLLNGMELNRKAEREKFGLVTKFRPTYSTAYGEYNNTFVCEAEEIVVSSPDFSFDDFIDVRKISFMVYLVYVFGYYKKVFDYLTSIGIKIVPLLDNIVSSTYFDDFEREIRNELFDSYEEMYEYLKSRFRANNNKIIGGTRLNPLFAAKLIYTEKWFKEMITGIINSCVDDDTKQETLADLILISDNEWIDIRKPREKRINIGKEALKILGIRSQMSNYKFPLTLSLSQQQFDEIETYNKHYKYNGFSYYYNVFDVIRTRKYLRYQKLYVK